MAELVCPFARRLLRGPLADELENGVNQIATGTNLYGVSVYSSMIALHGSMIVVHPRGLSDARRYCRHGSAHPSPEKVGVRAGLVHRKRRMEPEAHNADMPAT